MRWTERRAANLGSCQFVTVRHKRINRTINMFRDSTDLSPSATAARFCQALPFGNTSNRIRNFRGRRSLKYVDEFRRERSERCAAQHSSLVS